MTGHQARPPDTGRQTPATGDRLADTDARSRLNPRPLRPGEEPVVPAALRRHLPGGPDGR